MNEMAWEPSDAEIISELRRNAANLDAYRAQLVPDWFSLVADRLDRLAKRG